MGLGRVFENRCPVNDIYTYVVVFFFFIFFIGIRSSLWRTVWKKTPSDALLNILVYWHTARAPHTQYTRDRPFVLSKRVLMVYNMYYRVVSRVILKTF